MLLGAIIKFFPALSALCPQFLGGQETAWTGIFHGSKQRSQMLKGSALNTVSLASLHPCSAPGPFWLPHPSVVTLPFLLSLLLSQLALLREDYGSDNLLGQGACENYPVLPACLAWCGGNSEGGLCWGSQGASLCGSKAGRASWTGEVFTKNKTFETVFQQTGFQVQKDSRGHERRARGCERWTSLAWLLCPQSLASSFPLVSSHLQLTSKQEDLETRSSSWKHCCWVIEGVKYCCEIKAVILSPDCMPPSPVVCFWFCFQFIFPGSTLYLLSFSKSGAGFLKYLLLLGGRNIVSLLFFQFPSKDSSCFIAGGLGSPNKESHLTTVF